MQRTQIFLIFLILTVSTSAGLECNQGYFSLTLLEGYNMTTKNCNEGEMCSSYYGTFWLDEKNHTGVFTDCAPPSFCWTVEQCNTPLNLGIFTAFTGFDILECHGVVCCDEKDLCNDVFTTNPEIVCPKNATMQSSYFCDYISWRILFLQQWQPLFIDWSANNEVPIPPCPNLKVRCKNVPLTKVVVDGYGCNIAYCEDGLYTSGPDITAWRLDYNTWNDHYQAWSKSAGYF